MWCISGQYRRCHSCLRHGVESSDRTARSCSSPGGTDIILNTAAVEKTLLCKSCVMWRRPAVLIGLEKLLQNNLSCNSFSVGAGGGNLSDAQGSGQTVAGQCGTVSGHWGTYSMKLCSILITFISLHCLNGIPHINRVVCICTNNVSYCNFRTPGDSLMIPVSWKLFICISEEVERLSTCGIQYRLLKHEVMKHLDLQYGKAKYVTYHRQVNTQWLGEFSIAFIGKFGNCSTNVLQFLHFWHLFLLLLLLSIDNLAAILYPAPNVWKTLSHSFRCDTS